MKKLGLLTATAAALVLANPAQALPIMFEIPASPVPDYVFDDFGFGILDVYYGPEAHFDVVDIYFGSAATIPGGGIEIVDRQALEPFLNAYSVQLFSGTTSAPTFLTGTFSLTEWGGGPRRYKLVIAPSVSSGPGIYKFVITEVPETSTWAMMIGGLGLAGGALRRRRMKDREITFRPNLAGAARA